MVLQGPVVSSAPVLQPQILNERVIDEVAVESCPVKTSAPVCPEDEIVEEHIIRRRVRADCDSTTNEIPKATEFRPAKKSTRTIPSPQPEPQKIETKPKKKR